MNRQWLGIDVTYLAIALIESRLKGQYDLKPKTDYRVVGVPADLASALDLFKRDPYQFQFWAFNCLFFLRKAPLHRPGHQRGKSITKRPTLLSAR